MQQRWRWALGAAVLAIAGLAGAAEPSFQITPVDDAWFKALPMDPQAATNAFMARIPPEVQARANAYFEGGYWLQLWNFLLGLAVAALLLFTPWSTRWRDALRQRLRRPFLADAAYGALYLLAGTVLTLPLSLYQGFVRERAYGLATQDFGAWFGEQLMQTGISLLLGGLAIGLLYAVLRASGARWWLWGAVAMTSVMAVTIAIGPVFIEPLFNTYKPMPEGLLKDQLLRMAQANGVPVDNVLVFDASRQSTRVSANVAGLMGTAAVRLNDNLLNRASPDEVVAVMAHEIGHYALNHIPKMLLEFGVLIAAGFLFCDAVMRALLARWGTRWRIQGMADVGGLPLLAAVFATWMFLATPLLNTIIRVHEVEADLWGLNLAREPLAEAEVLLKLVEYRKPDPGPIEEFIFFDHPSTRTRVFNAMQWRAQLGDGAEP
ncbi:M48 family metallopeptidase [Ideonella alba]|uniref:M48 family metallopeptidase n=1 Tax=Ideonella alba TaxID=2824118 RepID=A0A940YAS3_9BURK|nr:M48 family metallopeptidase [Ideonella alba]MBQ0929307.1 M48 family metallopeptidase [Ideonella alba]